jgi:hypothetical protein
MKTLAEVQKAFPYLPTWYTQPFHAGLVTILELQGKLHGCKVLREASKAQVDVTSNPEDYLTLEMCKDICDFIKGVEVPTDNERFAHAFSVWAWGKAIPTEVKALEEFVLRFMKEQNVKITI